MKILLAVDGSKYAQAAIEAVGSQIRKDNAEVLVLEIVEPHIFATPPGMAPGYEPELEELMKEEFQRARETVDCAAATLKAQGFKASTRVIEAETRTGILDFANEWHADLIVLGSHGRKGLQRLMLGSVAESVARGAYCSVLIIRSEGGKG